jgi:hypothetical protein
MFHVFAMPFHENQYFVSCVYKEKMVLKISRGVRRVFIVSKFSMCKLNQRKKALVQHEKKSSAWAVNRHVHYDRKHRSAEEKTQCTNQCTAQCITTKGSATHHRKSIECSCIVFKGSATQK